MSARHATSRRRLEPGAHPPRTMVPIGFAVLLSLVAGMPARAQSATTSAHPTSAAAATQPGTNPRFGRWLLKSDAAAPASNIMTYEPLGTTGMKVTIQAVNARGDTTRWWYTTEFDGKDMPVTGNAGQSHAAVRVITPTINEITNKKDGRVTQRLINVLSHDGNTIAVTYMRDDGAGHTTGVTFATYERIK